MRRFAVACTVVAIAALAATGAWALPTAEPEPEPLPSPAPSPAAREVPAPLTPAEIAESVTAVPRPARVVPTVPTVPTEPATTAADHLSVPEDAAAPPVVVETTTTTTAPPRPKATVAFTASQAYGSCGEDVPYDIFSGTATPGSTVTVSSPYGSGTTTADGSGHWERRVDFPAAPRDETFAVTVAGLGGTVTLHFTATGGATPA